MPPQLTEAWGIAYFQILITLIVFAFGIPAFIYQIIAPESIRDIMKRYMKGILRTIIFIEIFFAFISLCFVWVLHPCTNPLIEWHQYLGAFLITLAITITILIWWLVLAKSLRKYVVNTLKKRLYKRFVKDGPKRFKKDSDKLDTQINDLMVLGERSEAGYEKEIVLNAISNLIEKIQKSSRYKGYDLETILRPFDQIVANKDKPGNENNFQLSVEILRNILTRLSDEKILNKGDEIFVYNALKEIGKKSVELKLSKIVPRIVSITPPNPETLFEIGVSAFKSDDYSASLTALNKLEALALLELPIESNYANDLLGLLAHFWTTNKSPSRRAEFFFNTYGNQFSSLDKSLEQAIEYHYNATRYDTADKLIEMKADIISRGTGAKKKSGEKKVTEPKKGKRRTRAN